MNKKLVKKYSKELEGWGFDIPGFEGTTQALNNLSLYKRDGNLPRGMSPNGNICAYSGLRSTEDYMKDSV